MPPILLILLAGAGVAYVVATKKPAATPTPAPHGGPLPPVPPRPPVPPEPHPVVLQPTLKANEVYHFTIQVAPDPNVDIMALLTGHLPAGLLPQTMPLPENLGNGTGALGVWSFDAAWTGIDGALLSSLNSSAVTFTGAVDAGAFAPGAPQGLPPLPPGLDPSLLGGGDPSQAQGMGFPSDPGAMPMGGGGGIGLPPPGVGPIPIDPSPVPGLPGPGFPPPFPPAGPGLPLPPAPHQVSFGPHPGGVLPPAPPKPPQQSFGPHATAASQQAQGMWNLHKVAGTLSQYHPHAGSAFRHWPYDVRPVPHLPPVPVGVPGGPIGVAGTLSGYNPHQHDWNRYPLRRAGSGNGHQ
jgi:hypothetical protein